MDEAEWPDPKPGIDPERHRLAIRLGLAAIVFVLLVFLTRSFLAQSLPLLWPPTDPFDQWSMLVMLHVFGYVLVPLLIGSIVVDFLLD